MTADDLAESFAKIPELQVMWAAILQSLLRAPYGGLELAVDCQMESEQALPLWK
jgi:hypothetical protein